MLNTQPSLKSDPNRWLFVASATAIAAMMFMGFAKNYYLRFWFGTRVISVMVHIHGLIMTAWVVLFLTQTLLVANRRTDLHRKLGLAGASLAIIVVGLGVYTIAGSIARQHLDTTARAYALAFVAFDGLSLLLFGGLVLTALGLRSRPQPHKRLMLMAMISLLPPAFGRFVAYFAPDNEQVIVLLLMCGSVLLCVFIDTLRNRRLHPAFAWSGVLVLLANLLTYFAQILD
jgi:hypothetical protein